MENMKTWKIENLSNVLFGLKELTVDLANLNYIRESQFQLPGLSALNLLEVGIQRGAGEGGRWGLGWARRVEVGFVLFVLFAFCSGHSARNLTFYLN